MGMGPVSGVGDLPRYRTNSPDPLGAPSEPRERVPCLLTPPIRLRTGLGRRLRTPGTRAAGATVERRLDSPVRVYPSSHMQPTHNTRTHPRPCLRPNLPALTSRCLPLQVIGTVSCTGPCPIMLAGCGASPSATDVRKGRQPSRARGSWTWERIVAMAFVRAGTLGTEASLATGLDPRAPGQEVGSARTPVRVSAVTGARGQHTSRVGPAASAPCGVLRNAFCRARERAVPVGVARGCERLELSDRAADKRARTLVHE